MMRQRVLSTACGPLALALACGLLNGCVAAVIPVVAAGAMGGRQVIGRSGERREASPTVPAEPTRAMAVPAPRVPPAISTAPEPAPVATVPSRPPAALPTHSWRAMVLHVAETLQARTRPVDSVVPAADATRAAPRFMPCEAKPYAVIVDADGTLLPGIDASPGSALRTDEAVKAFGDLRFGRVTVIFTTGRPAAQTAATEIALERAGLGPAMQGRELLSVADAPAGSTKSTLRVAVASQYCVLALVGDEPDDFSDLTAGDDAPVPGASRWGAGWFRVPARTTAG